MVKSIKNITFFLTKSKKRNLLNNTKPIERLNPYAKKESAATSIAIKYNTMGIYKMKKNKQITYTPELLSKCVNIINDTIIAAVQEEQDIQVKHFSVQKELINLNIIVYIIINYILQYIRMTLIYKFQVEILQILKSIIYQI